MEVRSISRLKKMRGLHNEQRVDRKHNGLDETSVSPHSGLPNAGRVQKGTVTVNAVDTDCCPSPEITSWDRRTIGLICSCVLPAPIHIAC